jgi:hypothetical protein
MPMAAAGGPPPTPPRSIVSGGMGALIGFGAVAVIGVLLWFLVLKPDSGTTPPGPTGPPTTSAPATTTPPPGTDTPPPSSPTDDGAFPAFTMNVCGSVDEEANCVDPFPIGPEGWVLPRTTDQFVIHLLGEGMKAGDVIKITAVDQATGQQVYELAWDPLPTEGLDFSLPVAYYTDPFTLEKGQTWSGTYEHILYYNDQPVTGWVYPLVITFR